MKNTVIILILCIVSLLVLLSFDSQTHSVQAFWRRRRRRRRRRRSSPPPQKRSNQNEIDTLGILTSGYTAEPNKSKFTSLLPKYGVRHLKLIDESDSTYRHVQCRVFLKNKYVIVSVRGTIKSKWNDWKTNFQIKKKTFDATRFTGSGTISSSVRGKVHKGFRNEYKLLQGEIHKTLSGYIKQGYSVIFSGHSQGGAIAALAATHYAIMYPHLRNKLYLVTIGAPRVGNKSFANFASSKLAYVRRFVTYKKGLFGIKRYDPVSKLPMKIIGYRSFGKRIRLRCKSALAIGCHPAEKYLGSANFF